MRLFATAFFALFLTACHSTPEMSDADLGIGDTPTPPNLPQPGAQSREMLLNLGNHPPLALSNANQIVPANASNPVALMSPGGGIITIWALKPQNWVWGYTPIDSYEFGDVRFWRILSFPNGQVQIQNLKLKTCLKGYKNGVIHAVCSTNDQAQFWNLNFFDNQAVQIQNVALKTCVQTPTIRNTQYFSIFLKQCVTSTESNLDQQWYITPILLPSDPIFVTNP